MSNKYSKLVDKSMWYKKDPYLRDLIEETEELFENAICIDKLDFEDFVNKFMKSEVKSLVDMRSPKECGWLPGEIMELLLKETSIKPDNGCYYRPDLAYWLGAFYTLLQYKTQIPSRYLIDIVTIQEMMRRAPGLHDVYLPDVVDRIIKERGLPMTVNKNPENILL